MVLKYNPELTVHLVWDDLNLKKVPVYSDAEPDQQYQHNTEWRDCKIRRENYRENYTCGGETYKRGGKSYKCGRETYKRGGTPS